MSLHLAFVVKAGSRSIGGAKRALKMAPHLSSNIDVSIIINDIYTNRSRIGRLKNVNGVFVDESSFLGYKQAVQRIQPDIVYTNGIWSENIYLGGGVNRIVEHAELYSKSEDKNFLDRLKYMIYEYISLFVSDKLVVVSESLKDLYSKRRKMCGTNNSIKYLPYGFDGKSPNNNDVAKFEYQCDHKLVYFGSLERSYGLRSIIVSVKELVSNGIDIKLIIGGDGSEKENLVDFANVKNISKNVVFEGFIKEKHVYEFLDSADVLVCPLKDTIRDKNRFPSKIPMYMSTGNPVVTCKIGQAYRILEDHGFYYEKEGRSEIKSAILDALNHGEVLYGKEKIKSYSWENISNEFLDWIKSYIKR